MRSTAAPGWIALSFAGLTLACGGAVPAPSAPEASGVSFEQSQRPRLQEEGAAAAYDAAAAPRAEAAPHHAPLSPSVGGPGNMGPGGIQPNDIGKPQVQPGATAQPGGQTRPPLASVTIRPTGILVCDEYLAALRTCVMQLPPAQRAGMEESIRHSAGAFASGAQQPAARQAMEDSCRQAHESIKGSCFRR